jgi:hypothetical protein
MEFPAFDKSFAVLYIMTPIFMGYFVWSIVYRRLPIGVYIPLGPLGLFITHGFFKGSSILWTVQFEGKRAVLLSLGLLCLVSSICIIAGPELDYRIFGMSFLLSLPPTFAMHAIMRRRTKEPSGDVLHR